MEFKSWDSVNEDAEKKSAFHQILWYIEKPLTLQQWSDLDDKMSDALEEVLGDDHYWGYAGPIPFDDWYEEAMKIYEEEKND